MFARCRALMLRLAGLAPATWKRWVYQHPRLLGPAAALLRRVSAGDEPVVVTLRDGPIAGMKLAVDAGTPNFYWVTGGYEQQLVPFLKQHARPGSVVMDVGAHIGYETLMLARCVGDVGLVLAFEPDPANRARLERNCRLNDLKQVRILGDALSDAVGSATFSSSGQTTSRLVSSGGGDGAAELITVPTVTLDALVYERGAPLPVLIKVDVEGHESAVLRGAARLLREQRPAMLIEVHSASSTAACAELLRAAGYNLQPLGNDTQAQHVEHVLAGEHIDDNAIERGYLAGTSP